jgi:hypothetical protein
MHPPLPPGLRDPRSPGPRASASVRRSVRHALCGLSATPLETSISGNAAAHPPAALAVALTLVLALPRPHPRPASPRSCSRPAPPSPPPCPAPVPAPPSPRPRPCPRPRPRWTALLRWVLCGALWLVDLGATPLETSTMCWLILGSPP